MVLVLDVSVRQRQELDALENASRLGWVNVSCAMIPAMV